MAAKGGESDANVQSALKSLVASIREDEIDDIIKWARATERACLGAQVKGDLLHTTQYSLVVALILENQLNDALVILDKIPDNFEPKSFAKAYCEYRLGNMKQATFILQKGPPSKSISHLALQAQLEYKNAHYDVAYKAYAQLLKTAESDAGNIDLDPDETRANLLAALAQSQIQDAVDVPALSKNATSYEQLHNLACYFIYRGESQRALDLLRQAAKVCREVLASNDDDEVENDELRKELGPIRAQMGVAMYALGQREAAMVEWEAAEKSGHAVSACVGASNMIAAGGSAGALDAHKRLERHAGGLNMERRLNDQQLRATLYNRALALLHLGRLDACELLVKQLAEKLNQAAPAGNASSHKKEASDPSVIEGAQVEATDLVWLLEAALLYRRGKAEEAVTLLEKHASNSAYASLGAAQQALMQNRVADALKFLTRARHLASMPSGAAVQAVLYDQQGLYEEADDALDTAAEYWEEKGNPYRQVVILEHRAVRLGKRKDHASAADVFADAVAVAEKAALDASIIKRLCMRYALALAQNGNADKAEQVFRKCGVSANAPKALSSKDIDRLELKLPSTSASQSGSMPAAAAIITTTAPKGTNVSAHASDKGKQPVASPGETKAISKDGRGGVDRKGAVANRTFQSKYKSEEERLAALKERRRRKRSKKTRPKNYDPNYVHPDPERWLPLRERSYYRRGKGKGRPSQSSGAAQGGAFTKEDAKRFDRTGKGKGPATGNLPNRPAISRSGGGGRKNQRRNRR